MKSGRRQIGARYLARARGAFARKALMRMKTRRQPAAQALRSDEDPVDRRQPPVRDGNTCIAARILTR